MSNLFSSPKAAEGAEEFNQLSPTGGSQIGTVGADGQFIADPSVRTQRTTESEFTEQSRLQQEALISQLLGQLSPSLPDQTTAQDIRGILPSAQAVGTGAPELVGVTDPSQIGQSIGDLGSVGTQFRDVSSVSPEGLSARLGGDSSTRSQQLGDQQFSAIEARLSPSFERKEEQLRQTLADRGIPIDSEAAKTELDNLRQSQGDQLRNAAVQSQQLGSAEDARLFGQGVQREQLGAGLQGQQFSQALGRKQLGAGLIGQDFSQRLAAANLQGQQRAQQVGEQQSVLQQALQKQLSLANLEAQQRGQQFGEIGSLAGFVPTFSPTPISTIQGAGAQQAGAGFGLLGSAIGAAGSAFGGKK